ncbi:MAG: DegV family protein [Bacillota bacterium]
MRRIALVTDSTCDLPQEFRQAHDIHVVPLSVIFGDENLLDGVTVTPEQFFQRLRTSAVHPSTSQPAPGDFANVYRQLLEQYDQIISIHLSSALSGTYQAAQVAKDMFPDADISLVDTRSASVGLGWVVLLASKAIAAGKSVAEVVDICQQAAEQQHILLTVETLDWLERNGRIGKASALLGNLLNVRPILQIEDGVVGVYEKARGKMEKVLNRMVAAMPGLVPNDRPVYLGVVHAERPELAAKLAELVAEQYQVKEQMVTTVGPVIGVHTGPGTLGFVVVPAII